jgi:hypothetical protein
MSVHHETNPVEPAGPEGWSDYWDLYTWELSDPCEVAELESAEVERITDVLDAPPDEWPTADEIAEYEAEVESERWLHVLEATRDFYRRHGSFGDWLASQGGATEERDVFGNWFNG